MNFKDRVEQVLGGPLRSDDLKVLQVNVGYRCNMACKHCHVQAGPARTEIMSREHMDRILQILGRASIATLDITGGAPEMNPSFRYLVAGAVAAGVHVIVRTNLTIFHEEGFHDLPGFYREHKIEVIASLPYYREDGADRVRGKGAFAKSIAGLQMLNSLGYGKEDGLPLNLVFNPPGAFLPPEQSSLEEEYRRRLDEGYGIAFNRLYTFANMPIGRFSEFLVNTGNCESYMKRLEGAFNPGTLEGIMCRHIISVGWDGKLYDCDFNQMAGLAVPDGLPRHIDEFDAGRLSAREIATAEHCYACTAGQGST